jgi:hypothetical protein
MVINNGVVARVHIEEIKVLSACADGYSVV